MASAVLDLAIPTPTRLIVSWAQSPGRSRCHNHLDLLQQLYGQQLELELELELEPEPEPEHCQADDTGDG